LKPPVTITVPASGARYDPQLVQKENCICFSSAIAFYVPPETQIPENVRAYQAKPEIKSLPVEYLNRFLPAAAE
jgi:hypothetical protein